MLNRSHTKITEEALKRVVIRIPTEGNEILKKTLDLVNSNREIKTLWKVINVNATDRMGYPDHGPIHFQIVAANAIQIARLFEKKGVQMSVVKDFALTNDHAEVIIFLGSVMHDLGMSIHRNQHEEFSLFLANNLLHEILSFLPIEERAVVTSEVLHTIIGHRNDGNPITIEAGIVRLADALDMVKGRSRVPYDRGVRNIHSISHHAIEDLEIVEGKERPVEVKIHMSNPAGMFQIDDLMQQKLKGSGIEEFIKVSAYLKENGNEKLYKEFAF